MTTLTLLDAFRYSPFGKNQAVIHPGDRVSVDALRLKKPISPCHYGIGTLFMQTEYPFRDIISFIICMFCPFTLMRNEMSAFWKQLHQFGNKISRGQKSL